ncbi:MAG: hypothetical protein ABL999_05115 [Pyrinomonadaceae bacterium]
MQIYRLFGVFILALFLFSLTATAQQTEAGKTTVEIKRSVFYLNGTAAKLPIKASELEKIIGKPDRMMEGARKVATWDKLGLTGYQKTDSDEFIEIGVILNVTDNAFEFTPEKPFSGSFNLDGAKITSTSTRNSVNQKKTGGKFKPIPLVGMLSDYKTGGLYLVMWQEAKPGPSGSGKILQINVGIDPK